MADSMEEELRRAKHEEEEKTRMSIMRQVLSPCGGYLESVKKPKKVTTTCETCEELCDFFAAEPRKVCNSCLIKGLRTYAELKRSGTL